MYLSCCVQAFFGDISGLAPDHCTKANLTTGFPGGASGKEPARQRGFDGRHASHSLSREHPLERGMATQSSVLAWRIPWTEEPGGFTDIWRDLVKESGQGSWVLS